MSQLSAFNSGEIYRSLSTVSEMQGHLASLGVHAKRYERLLDTIIGVVKSMQRSELRLLDVGPWWQTSLLRQLPSLKVDTLGLLPNPPAIDQPRAGERYFQQDLNKAVSEAYRDDLPQYDIVVMAEVIEHLPMAPTHLLRRIKPHIKPGGRLVLTTPNAVALQKRLKMIRGQFPYTLISENPLYPSHFREYTLTELRGFADQTGFQVIGEAVTNDWYWRYNPSLAPGPGMAGLKGRIATSVYELIGAALPATLKQSIVVVLTH